MSVHWALAGFMAIAFIVSCALDYNLSRELDSARADHDELVDLHYDLMEKHNATVDKLSRVNARLSDVMEAVINIHNHLEEDDPPSTGRHAPTAELKVQ